MNFTHSKCGEGDFEVSAAEYWESWRIPDMRLELQHRMRAYTLLHGRMEDNGIRKIVSC